MEAASLCMRLMHSVASDRQPGSLVHVLPCCDSTPDDPYNVIEYDAIIRATGWRYIKPDMFCDETCKVATTDSAMMDGRFPELNSNFESTSVPNLFWIGANSQGRRFKQDTSGFIHGFRYLVQVTLKILEWRELGKTLSTTDRLV